MEMNHHIMAKTTTDAVMAKFKSGAWTVAGGIGQGLYRVGCDATFPSPDAVFADADSKMVISFEFKPTTETKRGILTGVGQSVAYLQHADLSFLIAPRMLQDYPLGNYLKDLYQSQLTGKVPTGLILYDNNNPSHVELAQTVEQTVTPSHQQQVANPSRFWAKHQDLPVALFHLLLHCYYLRRVSMIDQDAFEYCWFHHLINPDVATTLQTRQVVDVCGQPIKTVAGKKLITFLEDKIKKYRKQLTPQEMSMQLDKDIAPITSGDNYYQSIRKNFLTFMKHIGCIDSEGMLTDEGYQLYHLGMANTPSSKVFHDYFARTVLLKGHHLELLIDLSDMLSTHAGMPPQQVLKSMEQNYESRGMIKRNPGRMAGMTSKTAFLKYETILWHSLGLINQKDIAPAWRRITEICLLPEL